MSNKRIPGSLLRFIGSGQVVTWVSEEDGDIRVMSTINHIFPGQIILFVKTETSGFLESKRKHFIVHNGKTMFFRATNKTFLSQFKPCKV